MSWSVGTLGKPAAARAALDSQFGAALANLAEPEKTIAAAAQAAINAALDGYPADDEVRVEAYGSQAYKEAVEGDDGKRQNKLTMRVAPVREW